MWANDPEMARRWEADTPPAKLPMRVADLKEAAKRRKNTKK